MKQFKNSAMLVLKELVLGDRTNLCRINANYRKVTKTQDNMFKTGRSCSSSSTADISKHNLIVIDKSHN